MTYLIIAVSILTTYMSAILGGTYIIAKISEATE